MENPKADNKENEIKKEAPAEEAKQFAGPRRGGQRPRQTEEGKELIEKVVTIKRVAKVVKGGRKFSFNALVVAGDGKGNVGFGFGKGNEVADAIRKGLNDAKKNFFRIPLKGTSIPHEIIGHYNPIRSPKVLEINGDRARYWLGVGAQPSDTVVGLLKKQSILDSDGKVIAAPIEA